MKVCELIFFRNCQSKIICSYENNVSIRLYNVFLVTLKVMFFKRKCKKFTCSRNLFLHPKLWNALQYPQMQSS
jgi:hypothetical protein